MPKPRLGVGFEGALYPGELKEGDAPLLSREPAPAAIQALLKLIETYDVVVYPVAPARGRAVAIEGWLYTQLVRYFTREHHPDPRRATMKAIEVIEIGEHRPHSGVLYEACAIPFRGAVEWPLEEIDRAGGVASNRGEELA